MWESVSKDVFDNGRDGWPLICKGVAFGGGEYAEYGHKDGHGLWRYQKTVDGVESWYRFKFSR